RDFDSSDFEWKDHGYIERVGYAGAAEEDWRGGDGGAGKDEGEGELGSVKLRPLRDPSFYKLLDKARSQIGFAKRSIPTIIGVEVLFRKEYEPPRLFRAKAVICEIDAIVVD